jgi:uncharacterized protein (TIGR03067 family)
MLARTLVVGLAAVLLLPTLVRANDEPKGDKDLDGQWRSTSFSLDGEKFKGDGNTVLMIDGKNLTFQTADNPAHKSTATFKVDTAKTPHTIDMSPQGLSGHL